MLSAIAVVPSAPVMVPELASGAAPECDELRAAVLRAAGELPDRWVAIGVAAADRVIAPGSAGTFAGYGVDVPVALGPETPGTEAEAVRPLPLCALITGWVRGQCNPRGSAQVRAYAAGHDASAAVSIGRALRAEIDATADPIGVLVVADGANTLNPSAPGGYDAASVPVQEALDDALATGDVAALASVGGGIVGAVAFAVLAGLAEPTSWSAREYYRGAPYGVGYFAGVWLP
ncbi:hypothetical protein [Mycolicibacterium sp. YH-1]|uniref:hypothetical protein n=1 Tax=Mycolicibacterium sp. YH-1 TaxID=2908837 RepID=UPI001F4C3F44|nr:hypothetical protein [Mycolicibacterium sp. YH-1]UNB50208.1 hypothetical protein L0M16_19685 [Mycolicibacterium sp. YH-1]